MKGMMLTLMERNPYDHMEDLDAMYIAGYLTSKGFSCIYKQIYKDNFILSMILKENINYICLPMYSLNKDAIYKACKEIKLYNQDIIICICGLGVSIYKDNILIECKYIDYLIKGEGELVAFKLFETLKNKGDLGNVKGLLYRSENEITENKGCSVIEKLDDIPWPSRTFIKEMKLIVASVQTARGYFPSEILCKDYDTSHKWRSRSIPDIINEIKYLHKEYNVDCINFIDRNFAASDKGEERLNNIINALINLEFSIFFSACFEPDFYKMADFDLIHRLKKAGLSRVCINIDMSNESIEKVYKITQLFKETEIPFYPKFDNFNPYITTEKLKENIQYLSSFIMGGRILLFLTQQNVYKDSEMYQKMKKDGLLNKGDISYRYKDIHIEKLRNHLQKKVDILNQQYNNIITELDTALLKSDTLSYLLKLRLKKAEIFNMETESIFEEFEENNNKIKNELNQKYTYLYEKLVLLAEKESYCDFDFVIDKILAIDDIMTQVIKLKSNSTRLLKNLIKKGYRYKLNI